MSAKYLTSPEWLDDQKAAVLFAPFREKSLNPHSWERKMKFWTDALTECAQAQNDTIVDLKTYTGHFERKGKYPQCLGTVTAEMLRAGKLQKLSEFQRRSNSWALWGFDTFVRRPLAWGITKVLVSASSAENTFIIPHQVQNKCREVLEQHYSQVQHESTDNVMELSAFRAQCRQLVKSEAECDIIMKQLELDNKVLLSKDKDGTMIVKICGQSENKVQPIQEIELNILRIQRVMRNLEQQIEALCSQLDVHTKEARKLVREGKKTLALHQLRKRRTLQRQMETKSSCFDTLHDIIHRIEDASSNEMVVKAYESGLGSIRQLTGDVTLNRVDKVLDDLQEVFADQEEINQSIAEVTLPGSEVNADDLEQELRTILEGGGDRSQKQDDISASGSNADIDNLASDLASFTLDDLPDVPTGSPRGTSPTVSPQKHLPLTS